MRFSPYAVLMLAGLLVSGLLWWRLARRDKRLVSIFVAALVGAFLGAKLVYVAAEGWLHWHEENRWLVLATGKTILGGLLGGYAAVEIAKRWVGYAGVTGDWFALITPVAIILGRIGCVLHGCCLGRQCGPSWFTVKDAFGVPRWPAAQVELLFNALAIAAILLLRFARTSRKPYLLAGQHFHLYLIAYGLFRIAHEPWRETPKILGPISGYQIAALAVTILGLVRFVARQREWPKLSAPPSVVTPRTTGQEST